MNDILSDPEIQAEIGGLLNVDKLDFTHTLELQPHTKAPMPSVLHSIIDLVSRTEYASANVANFLSEAPEHYSGRAGPLQPIRFMTPEERKRVFSLAWKGITGEEKHTYDELIERRFPEWGGPKKFAVSLAAAIALDPLTYLSASWVAKPVKIVGELKPVQKAAKALEATKLGEAFIPYAGTPKEFKNFMNETRFERQFEVDRVISEVKELNKGLVKEDREMLSYYRQHPDKIDLMAPKLQNKLEDIGSRFDDIIEESYARGSLTDAQYKAWKVREGTYLPGVYKGQKRLSGVLPPDYTTAQPSFLKQKRFETLEDARALANDFTELSKATSIEDMQKLAEERGIDFAQAFKASETHNLPLKAYTSQAKAYAKRYTPEEDILKLLGVRKLEDVAWKMRDEFLDNVVSQFGKQIPWDTKVLPEGYGIYFPKGNIRIYPRTALNPKAAKVLDDAVESFKKLATEQTGEVSRKTTVTKTVGPGIAEEDKTKAVKIWEDRVRDSMKNRGFSEGEANIAIEHIRSSGGKTSADGLVETIAETTEETFKKSVNMDDLDDLVSAGTIASMLEQYPSITKNVPAYMMPKAVAREVNRASRAFIGDSTTNWLLNMYDTALNAWKSMATSLRVPFHLRNFYSNLFLSHQAGINNPLRFLEALDVQQAVTWKLDRKFQFGKYTYTADQLNRVLHFLGVRGTGWLGSDIEKQALGEIDWLLKGPQKAVTHPFKMVGRGGRAVGTAIEDNARIAVFIDQLKKGATPTEASRQVRKYLFDYSDLTPFERDVMKRIRPFYTWTRKNLALQTEQIVRKPKVHSRYAKALRAYDEPEDANELANKPAYFDKMMYRKTAMRTAQGKPIYAALDLPPLIFNQIVDPRDFMASLGPYRTIGELIVNKKFFPELTDIEKKPGALVRAPVWIQALPEKVTNYLEMHKILSPMLDVQSGKMVLGIRGKYLHAINGAFPLFSEMGRVYAEPITLSDERPEMWKQTYLSGISQKAFDEQQAVKQRLFQLGEIEDRINFYVRQRDALPSKQEIPTLFPEEELRKIIERDFEDLFTD